MAEEAEKKFLSIVSSFKDCRIKKNFFNWVNEFIANQQCQQNSCNDSKTFNSKGDILLSCIKSAIKERVPFEAVMKSENICYPTIGEDANLHEKNCIHVDAFLYDEDAVDDLVDKGKLSSSYCKVCGSTNIEQITFITHSTSTELLQFIFQQGLPTLKGKTIVDVGSRLGSVLYGAYVYSEAEKIIGIEMNTELCKLQNDVILRFKLGKRISIYEGNMLDMADVLASAAVIVLNNVFEWFIPVEEQIELWKFLRMSIPRGCTVVASPSIDKSLGLLDTGIEINKWLKKLPVPVEKYVFIEENSMSFYRVL